MLARLFFGAAVLLGSLALAAVALIALAYLLGSGA